MTLQLDHVFVCTDPGAPEATRLLELGIREGTPNVHPGQGTANRRFFFTDGFLELLWVANENEAQSPLALPTRLWERWSRRSDGACPFGLAFRPSSVDVEAPPFSVRPYRPAYLPPGREIHLADTTDIREPELFYLAWPPNTSTAMAQPSDHAVPLRRLISVDVGLPCAAPLSAASSAALNAGLIAFHESVRYELIMKFDSPVELRLDLRPTLPIVLAGSPARPELICQA